MAGETAPMGANLTASGATFRLWAPAARSVSVRGDFNAWADVPLERDANGYWFAHVPGVREGHQYKYFVRGVGSDGFKRDPCGRARTWDPPTPPPPACFVTNPPTFPWHDAGFRPPAFNDLILYQLHIGAFFAADAAGHDVRTRQTGRYLDLLYKLEYLAELGVTAVQLLPVQEFETMRSLGYNGVDFFSPEVDYTIRPTDPDFRRYFDKANELLGKKGLPPYGPNELNCQTKQLMALIDLCHVYGIAVIFDLVYNHAGGDFGQESMYFLDLQPTGDNNRSLYFTDQGWAGGLVFAYWKREVRQFLIDNAAFFFNEYHVDGFRFDEVTVIDRNGGWEFLQNLTDTLRHRKPEAPLIAEYWADQSAVLRPRGEAGAGFDAVVDSGLRQAVRGALAHAAAGGAARVNLDPVAQALYPKHGGGWRSVHHLENHDVVRVNNDSDRQPRVPALADGSNPRSWYARSRSRWATGLLLTAPGIPMLFMGQEFLEDKYWSDSTDYYKENLIWWNGLDSDRAMQDHLRFTRELIDLRKRLPALRADPLNVFHVHNDNRVIAFHRWTAGGASDVVVVASLREETWWGYDLGFPRGGEWREAFNSDVYDNWSNPWAAGNGGRLRASGPPMHGMPTSARVVTPANGVVVFAVGLG
ncbi:alpha amylase C-terminal domain-containing protein [bacterium]|nr:alpha amylase C-terminal domain-containing protein [bacterium]